MDRSGECGSRLQPPFSLSSNAYGRSPLTRQAEDSENMGLRGGGDLVPHILPLRKQPQGGRTQD